MRATAQDKDASAMMGINVNRTISFTFLIAGSLAGAAGVVYSLYFTSVKFDQGFQLGLIAFTAAVLGGIGNLPGAVLGAVLIGLLQGWNEGLNWHAPGSDWTAVDRLRDPDPDPRLPARRACSASRRRRVDDDRRAAGGGRAPEPAARPLAPPADADARRRSRSALAGRVRDPRSSSPTTRSATPSLLGGAIYWLRRLPERRLRLGAMAAIVGLLALLALVGQHAVVARPAARGASSPSPRSRSRHRSRALPVAAVLAAIMYPFYFAHLFTIPVFGAWPDVATGVYMLVFMMMAVGLNIVVGYAGLLDLGYVAFYAIGAYTAAWFASQQFAGQKCPTKGVSVANCAEGSSRRPTSTSARSACCPAPAASTSRSGCCCCSAASSRRSSGS